jgi:hypothetical protein
MSSPLLPGCFRFTVYQLTTDLLERVRIWVTLRLAVYQQSVLLEAYDQYFFQLNICGYSPYVISSLTRGWIFRLQLLISLASAVILGYESRGTHDHIILSYILDFPNLEGQVPLFISPRNRVAELYLQALGSLFFGSYDSQDYGGGIRPRLRTRLLT